jgi:hypothetical protein
MAKMEINVAGAFPMLGMPTHRDLPVETVRSLLQTQALLLTRGMPMALQTQSGGSIVHHARTHCAYNFLKSECTHLFFVDSDMEWDAEDFFRFVALGCVMECVCATYTRKKDEPEFFVDTQGKALTNNEYGCIPVQGAGLGFTIIQRKVMEQIGAKQPVLKYAGIDEPIPRYFRCDEIDGEARGEDHAFFADVRELGYKVYLDPTVTLGHVGSKVYKASIMDNIVTNLAEAAA